MDETGRIGEMSPWAGGLDRFRALAGIPVHPQASPGSVTVLAHPKLVCVSLVSAALLSGCGSSAPRQPPGLPPTPTTVTMQEPGGDAYDPHAAALARQLEEGWGWRNDKDDQVHAPLSDWKNWKRVRYRLVDHLTGFRYGDDHHVVTIAVVVKIPEGQQVTSAACMQRFEREARSKADSYGVELEPTASHEAEWRKDPLVIHTTEGAVDFLFRHYEFSAAWAAYPAYAHGCLVYAVAVPWDGHEKLANQVRDRWVKEGFSGMRTLTDTLPYRK